MLSRLRVDLPVAFVDAMLVVGSFVSLLAVRFDGDIPDEYSSRMFAFLPLVVTIHLGSNLAWGLYGQIWRYAGATEAGRVVLAGSCAGIVVFVVNPLRDLPVPRSVAIFGAVVATMFIGLVRFQHRLFSFRRRMDRSASRVVIVGAGSAGAAIVRDMRRSGYGGPTPVLVVDDDPRKQGRSLLGVPVVGDTDHLQDLVRRARADQVLLAVPSADQGFVVLVMRAAEAAHVPLKVLPPVRDLLGGAPSVRAARDLRIEDVLGRQQVGTDLDRIRAAVADRRVLVTGAGGSIGAEIAAQVAALDPAVLLLLDHDETHLHDVAARLGPAVPIDLVLADICDRDRLAARFAAARPALVFHAAAHKHVPLLEAHPLEAVETNVLGTANVVDCAAAAGVGHLVFISSDKAVSPNNVLGRSKRLGEQVTIRRAPDGARWCAVRFGNVVGSRGSVVPTFAAQIAAGGPVTVTDPRMTRYFMSVHEAVQLVLQAAVLAQGGEVFMLDMGQPVNILELAERMIRLSGRVVGTDVPIRIVGRRPGEKLAEDLRAADERSTPTAHPAILRVDTPSLPADELDRGIDRLAGLVAVGAEDDAARVLGELANQHVALDDGTMSAATPR
ncbi:MAG TPA: nucleoside-diphosphate sugar epimerase/dehydratase [Acidimicrobiales bacterium]|nr:nucleoside-diphosphate sugar epimerase/dehydratase [Acidimicrobiales bacterium]